MTVAPYTRLNFECLLENFSQANSELLCVVSMGTIHIHQNNILQFVELPSLISHLLNRTSSPLKVFVKWSEIEGHPLPSGP